MNTYATDSIIYEIRWLAKGQTAGGRAVDVNMIVKKLRPFIEYKQGVDKRFRDGTVGLDDKVVHGLVQAVTGLVKSDLSKAGPYIGPRGGKWADPQHTIPWHEGETRVMVPKKEIVEHAGWRDKIKGLGLTKLPPPSVPIDQIRVDLSGDIHSHAVLAWRDSKGRLQQSYTPQFHQRNAAEKWARVERMSGKREHILAEMDRIISDESASEKKRDSALIVTIIGLTGLRPGSKESAKGEHFGVSTLRIDHVSVEGNTIKFSFIGKSAKHNTAEIRDKVIADIMKEKIKHGGRLFSASESDARDLVASIESGVKLKDFRTYLATKLAADALEATKPPPPLPDSKIESRKLIKSIVVRISDMVADTLNNTRADAKASYIHPAILQTWLDSIGAEAIMAKSLMKIIMKKAHDMLSSLDDEDVEWYPYPDKYKELLESKEDNPIRDLNHAD